MTDKLPSQNMDLLRSVLGKKIYSVRRQIFKGDMDLDDWQQNADGPVEFIFDDNTVMHFIAETETFSVGVAIGNMPRYGNDYVLIDVSDNSFWRSRIGLVINRICYLKPCDLSEDYPSEFGVEFEFNNNYKVLIEYLDDEDNPDMIRVGDRTVSGILCERVFI